MSISAHNCFSSAVCTRSPGSSTFPPCCCSAFSRAVSCNSVPTFSSAEPNNVVNGGGASPIEVSASSRANMDATRSLRAS
eukprot:3936348-Rhodomonas_salina.1